MTRTIPAPPRVAIESKDNEPKFAVALTVHGKRDILTHNLSMTNAFYLAHGVAMGIETLTGHPCPVDFLGDVEHLLADSLILDPPAEDFL